MSFNLLFFLILFGGWFLAKFFSKIGLPSVLGMVIWGIFLGQFFHTLMPPSLSEIEPLLKSFALIVILLRAGLGINKRELRKTGRVAVKMAFLPCIIEAIALTIAIHYFFQFEWVVAAMTAFMLSAVSPAVIVPSMLNLKDGGFGKKNEVPTIILAGASIDDVFAISMFSLFLHIAMTGEINLLSTIISIPLSLLIGIIPGIIVGILFVGFLRKDKHLKIQATEKVLLLISLSLLLVQIGDIFHSAALLGIMTIGFIILEKEEKIAHQIANKLAKVWIFAEIILFVLIGMSVDVQVAWSAGLMGVFVISIGLLFRMIGVYISTVGSNLGQKERLFCMIAYIPKATVQAALGGVALSLGLMNGDTILAIAVLSILFTAPIGLIGIKVSAKHLLK